MLSYFKGLELRNLSRFYIEKSFSIPDSFEENGNIFILVTILWF